MVKHYQLESAIGKKYHLKHFPNSIVAEYFSLTDKKNDNAVLADIVKRRNRKRNLPKNTCVIHLRIGDVINNTKASIVELVSLSTDSGLTEMEKYYRSYIKSFAQIKKEIKTTWNNQVNNIIIVAGSHVDCNQTKSCNYLSVIKKLLETEGYTVTMRLGGDADEDFIFMCMAPYFIGSGGGYSKLITEVRKKLPPDNSADPYFFLRAPET